MIFKNAEFISKMKQYLKNKDIQIDLSLYKTDSVADLIIDISNIIIDRSIDKDMFDIDTMVFEDVTKIIKSLH